MTMVLLYLCDGVNLASFMGVLCIQQGCAWQVRDLMVMALLYACDGVTLASFVAAFCIQQGSNCMRELELLLEGISEDTVLVSGGSAVLCFAVPCCYVMCCAVLHCQCLSYL